jgi:hypothetical protein
MRKQKIWFKKSDEEEKELLNRFRNTEFEKGDVSAMIIAALITIMPVIALVTALFVAVVWIFFRF